jgi:hypothetical protein
MTHRDIKALIRCLQLAALYHNTREMNVVPPDEACDDYSECVCDDAHQIRILQAFLLKQVPSRT